MSELFYLKFSVEIQAIDIDYTRSRLTLRVSSRFDIFKLRFKRGGKFRGEGENIKYSDKKF